MKQYAPSNIAIWLGLVAYFLITACSQSESNIQWPNRFGATVKDGYVRFRLYAPEHRSACLLTDLNGWEPQIMPQSGDTFSIVVRKGAGEHMCYQYLIDDSIYIADPYSTIVLDRNRDWISPAYSWARQELPPFPDKAIGQVSVCDFWKRPYRWRCEEPAKVNPLNMTIYEMDAFDFAPGNQMNSSFIEAAMNRIRHLGVNAIALCPTNCDETGLTSFHFAHDKSFGPSVNLKLLIDTIHQAGMAVILDMDLANISPESPLVMMNANEHGEPSAQNPWAYPSSTKNTRRFATLRSSTNHVRQLCDSIISFWVSEFRPDGIRLRNAQLLHDPTYATSAFQEDKRNNLKHLANTIWKEHPNLLIVCENSGAENEEAELAKLGFTMTTECGHDFRHASVGENTPNLTNIDYKKRGWWAPRVAGVISPLDSLDTSVPPSTMMKRNKAYLATFLSVPGPKIIQRGQESCGCRKGTNISPRDKDELHNFCAKILGLRSSMSVFGTNDYDTDLVGPVKTVSLHNGEESVLSIANLGNTQQSVHLPHTISGEWVDLISGKRYLTTSQGKDIVLAPSDFVILHAKP